MNPLPKKEEEKKEALVLPPIVSNFDPLGPNQV